MNLTAIEINEQKIDDSIFKIPDLQKMKSLER